MNRLSNLPGLLAAGLLTVSQLALPSLAETEKPSNSPPGVNRVGVFEVNQPAPVIELPLANGEGTGRLSDHEGRRLLLIQFASW